MSKGFKRVIGAVAAIAIPFAAPAIAGSLAGSAALSGTGFGTFLASKAGAAATGAVLGGVAAKATGQNVLTGAALGGLGGFMGAGGFSRAAAPGVASAAPATGAGLAVPGAATGAATGAVTTAAAPTLGGFFKSVGQGLLSNPAGVAQLAMTAFGRPPQDLTPAEKEQLEELRGLADTNQQLFEQRVSEANRLLQMAGQQAPQTEQAFAATKIAAERGLAEGTRGMTDQEAALARRRTSIRGAQAGATAAAAEETRGRTAQTQLLQAGLGALPTSRPQGYAGLALPTYNDLQKRRDQYARDLARGAGDLFGFKRDDDDEKSLA
jgi:hypothetical protein